MSDKLGKRLREVWRVKYFEGTTLRSKRFLGRDAEIKARTFARDLRCTCFLLRRRTYLFASVETMISLGGGAA